MGSPCVPLPSADIKHTVWHNAYEPSDDSFLLVDALQLHAGRWAKHRPVTVVEIGSGSGFVICSVARMLQSLGITAQLVAVDINPDASHATSQTLANHQIHGVEVLTMDLLSALGRRLQGHVDVLVFNPPYVPTPDEEVRQEGIAKAWAGGCRGRRVIDRVLEQLPHMLSKEGEVFMVAIAQNDPEGIIREMEEKGLRGTILMSRQADEEALCIVHLSRVSDA